MSGSWIDRRKATEYVDQLKRQLREATERAQEAEYERDEARRQHAAVRQTLEETEAGLRRLGRELLRANDEYVRADRLATTFRDLAAEMFTDIERYADNVDKVDDIEQRLDAAIAEHDQEGSCRRSS